MSDPQEEDPTAPRTYDWTLLVRLLRYLRPHKPAVAGAFLLIVAMAGLDLVGPWLTKVAIDRHIVKGDSAGLLRVCLLYLLVLGLALVVRYGQTVLLQMTGQKVVQDMRVEIFSHLQRLHVAYFDRHPVGRLMTRVTTDVDAVNELFTSGVVTVFGDLFTLFGIMGVMLALDWRLALVTFSVLPLFFLVTDWFRRGARESFRETRKWVAMMGAFLQENLSGMSVVQLFRREARNAEEFSRINRSHADANMRALYYYAVFYPAIEFLAILAIALILVYGGGQVLVGSVTLGALVAFVQYSERFWRPISDLSEKFNILQAAMASSERIFVLLDTRAEVVAPAQPTRPGADPGPGRVRGRLVLVRRPRQRRLRPARDLLRRGPRPQRGPRGRHGGGQDLDHQPPEPLLRRAEGAHHPRRRRRPRPRPACPSRVPRPRPAGRPPLQRDHRLQHPAGVGHPRRPGAAPPPARWAPIASSRPCPRATTRR